MILKEMLVGFLSRLFGNNNEEGCGGKGPPLDANTVINNYGKVLENCSAKKDVAPLSALPYKIDDIKLAIVKTMLTIKDPSAREMLKVGYMELGTFITDEEYELVSKADEFLVSNSRDKSKLRDVESSIEIRKRIILKREELKMELQSFIIKQIDKNTSHKEDKMECPYCYKVIPSNSTECPVCAMFIPNRMLKSMRSPKTEVIHGVEELMRQANNGDSQAQHSLGGLYLSGRGVPQDYTLAMKWFRKAAEQGDSDGQLNLGVMCGTGQGVPQDHVQAAKWFMKSAEQGNIIAQTSLGLSYFLGQGVPKDMVQSYFWSDLATSKATGDQHKVASSARDMAANMLSPEQLIEAQRLTREWAISHQVRSGHKQNVESMIELTLRLYEKTAQPNPMLPPLRFERADSRCRYLLFCLSTVQLACASMMKNPDAVLNECAQAVLRYCLADQPTYFGGAVNPQEAVNKVAPCTQDFLQHWSRYVDIVSGGNHQEVLNIVSAMLRDTESSTPAAAADTQRLETVALYILASLDPIRARFK